MIRDDYIMRQVQLLSQIVSRLRGLRHESQHDVALEETEAALHSLLGMHAGLAAGFAPEELVAQLAHGATPDLGQVRGALLAALFQEKALDLAALHRDDEAHATRLRALRVLLALHAEDGTPPFPDDSPRLQDLAVGVPVDEVPGPARAAWLRALEHAGDYAKAEDLLFEMRAQFPEDTDVIPLGASFYARLENKSDAQLEAGNLPRSEIAAGRAALLAEKPASLD